MVLQSYKMDVRSNARWTVSLAGENGEEVFWATLDRSSGHDDAQITVRVNENKYKTGRSATVLFTTEGGMTASVSLRQAGNEAGADAPGEATLRLGSYNLRMSQLDTDAENGWSARSGRLRQSILDADFDVFGVQEVNTDMQSWLNTEFADRYVFRFFSPYSQNGSGDRAQGIAFRKDVFVLSDWHYFWASNTPDTKTTNDTGSSGSFSRGGCCCVLTHKASGVKFFFMNTHACLNAEPNAAFAQVYVDQENRFNTQALPSFFVGDMNARPDSPASVTYRSYWSDSYDTAASRRGASLSYNGYTNASGKSRIDYLYHRGNGLDVKEFCISNKLYDGKFASDHFPVIVNVKISK